MKMFMLFLLAMACNASEKDYFLKNPYTGPTPTPGHCIIETHRQDATATTITCLNSECRVEYMTHITGRCPLVREEILLKKDLKNILVSIADTPAYHHEACISQPPHYQPKVCRILLSSQKAACFHLIFWPKEELSSTDDWSI